MTARERCVRLALRLQSCSHARVPEVCLHGDINAREHPVATCCRCLDRSDRASVDTTLAPTLGALTIQRP